MSRALLAVPAILATVLLALRAPAPLSGLVVGLNVTALLAFAYDKSAARSNVKRVPESVLHLLGFVGVAGASIGRAVFRHKTLHPSFDVTQGAACLLTFVAAAMP